MFKHNGFACLTKEFFHVEAMSYIAMLKKKFQLVFREVINYLLVFCEPKSSLSVCIPAF